MSTPLVPLGPLDTFRFCPKCALLGHHAIFDRGLFERPYILGHGGARIDMSGFGDPRDGTPFVEWRCTFCGHHWKCFDHPYSRDLSPGE